MHQYGRKKTLYIPNVANHPDYWQTMSPNFQQFAVWTSPILGNRKMSRFFTVRMQVVISLIKVECSDKSINAFTWLISYMLNKQSGLELEIQARRMRIYRNCLKLSFDGKASIFDKCCFCHRNTFPSSVSPIQLPIKSVGNSQSSSISKMFQAVLENYMNYVFRHLIK